MAIGYPLKFGKYLLLERVNVGGMAEVFKAKTFGVAGFERILAIKRILPSLVEDEEFIRMFIDEARIAVQLNHANIVQIYELGKHGEHYYIAMEYLPSRDLRSILDKMRASGQLMPIPQAAYTISKVCEGLDYAHRRRDPAGNPMNIIHRDVSPQNVLVSYEGEIKIIDFGIAKAANRASKTQAGVLKGKFGYMSPEQVRGLPIDRRSDIFAVGVLLYEMLTGERLFIGESDFSTLERVRNAEVPPPTTFNKKITAELEQIVLKALAREVEDRYQWASELAEDLQRFLIEDRSIYSAKRLAAYMKETYADIIGAERKKMEEFLSMSGDELENTGSGVEPPPPPDSAEGLPTDGIDFDEVEGPEDKTFVIEASEAGLALGQTGDDPAGQPPKLTSEPTNDDFLNEASLYDGDDDSDLEDDSKTEVSFVNPFDENHQADGTDPGGGLPSAVAPNLPTAAALSEVPSVPGPPRVSATAPTAPAFPAADIDPVAAAMMEDDPGISGARPSNGHGGVTSPGAPPIVDETPTRTQGGEGDDVAGRQLPAAHLQEATPGEALIDAAPVEASKRPPAGCLIALVAALGMSFFAMIGAAVALYWALQGGGATPLASLHIEAQGDAPASLKVLVDGKEVATSLPTDVEVQGDSALVVVEAEGVPRFEMAVQGLVAGASRTIPVVLGEGAGAVAVKEPAEGKDPKLAKASKEGKDPKGDAPTEDPGGEPPVAGGESGAGPAASGDRWRLSFAAIHADTRQPVRGAEVLLGERVIGRTPFEAEFAAEQEKVALRIRADGFVQEYVEFRRGGQAQVGPATVALKTGAGEAAGKAAPTGKEAADKPTGDEATAEDKPDDDKPVKVAKADAKPEDKEPARADPEPKKGEDKPSASSARDDDEGDEAAEDDDDGDKVASRKQASRSSKRSPPKKRTAREKDHADAPRESAREKESKKPAKEEGGMVKLAVGARPKATVYVDKKQRGVTPLMAGKSVVLTPGSHFMVLETDDKKKAKFKLDVTSDNAAIIYDFTSGKIVKKKGVQATIVP